MQGKWTYHPHYRHRCIYQSDCLLNFCDSDTHILQKHTRGPLHEAIFDWRQNFERRSYSLFFQNRYQNSVNLISITWRQKCPNINFQYHKFGLKKWFWVRNGCVESTLGGWVGGRGLLKVIVHVGWDDDNCRGSSNLAYDCFLQSVQDHQDQYVLGFTSMCIILTNTAGSWRLFHGGKVRTAAMLQAG